MTTERKVAYGLMAVGAVLAVTGIINLIGNIPVGAAVATVAGGALGFVGYKIYLKG